MQSGCKNRDKNNIQVRFKCSVCETFQSFSLRGILSNININPHNENEQYLICPDTECMGLTAISDRPLSIICGDSLGYICVNEKGDLIITLGSREQEVYDELVKMWNEEGDK